MPTDKARENSPGYPPDTLGLEDEEMRRLGYRVVDMVVDRLGRKTARPRS